MVSEKEDINKRVQAELSKAVPHVKKLLENGGYGIISLTFHQKSVIYIDENIKYKIDSR